MAHASVSTVPAEPVSTCLVDNSRRQHNQPKGIFEFLALVFCGALLAVGCSNSDNNISNGAAASAGNGGQSGSGGNGQGGSGAGGTAGTAGAAGSGSGVCIDACNTLSTCITTVVAANQDQNLEELDKGKCVAQCEIELAGEGYIAAEISPNFYKYMAEQKSDSQCDFWSVTGVTSWDYGWGWYEGIFYQANMEGTLWAVKDQKILDDCLDIALECANLGGAERVQFLPTCFFFQYRYNDATRADIAQCHTDYQATGWPTGCDPWDQCLQDHQPTWAHDVLWFGEQPTLQWLIQQSSQPFLAPMRATFIFRIQVLLLVFLSMKLVECRDECSNGGCKSWEVCKNDIRGYYCEATPKGDLPCGVREYCACEPAERFHQDMRNMIDAGTTFYAHNCKDTDVGRFLDCKSHNKDDPGYIAPERWDDFECTTVECICE